MSQLLESFKFICLCHLRDKKWINSTPLDTILRFYEIYEKKQKDLSSNDSMREDKKPRTIMFEAGEDNYFDSLHPARFLRFPLCNLEDIWKKVPVEIMEKYRNLDLASVGADCQLSEKTIARMHSRREILQLRYFYSGNAGVSRGPMVETKVKDGKSLGTIADFNWSNISNIKSLQDSIINYGLTKQMLFPYDQTGYLFMKLYNHYNWLQGAGNDLRRINLMQEHFNFVMEANASRASKKQSPFNYDEMEKSIKKMLDNKGLPNSPTALLEKSTDIGNQKKVVNSQKSSSSSAFGPNKNKFSSPQSKSRFICYDFNNQGKGCTRSKSAGGCKDANGKEYAHNCLFYDMVKKQYCYGPHSKQNHV